MQALLLRLAFLLHCVFQALTVTVSPKHSSELWHKSEFFDSPLMKSSSRGRLRSGDDDDLTLEDQDYEETSVEEGGLSSSAEDSSRHFRFSSADLQRREGELSQNNKHQLQGLRCYNCSYHDGPAPHGIHSHEDCRNNPGSDLVAVVCPHNIPVGLQAYCATAVPPKSSSSPTNSSAIMRLIVFDHPNLSGTCKLVVDNTFICYCSDHLCNGPNATTADTSTGAVMELTLCSDPQKSEQSDKPNSSAVSCSGSMSLATILVGIFCVVKSLSL